ncbi:MAG: hypothetical protein C4532_16625 [Candidatus Abyssobacteria bacterium SURF_17]|uniref:Uncharacterized protein n=1 Tax=Candidatus Abyssobacteria bacterium SURF_17 TaxID=2093361 RepID=A0A419ERL7_9BACT|nr:MAG: hypothetical protein C4532_16625 [Candidatus Abyssubacteria bacterium SURF_17]
MAAKRRIARMARIRYIVDPPPKGYVYPCTPKDVRRKLASLSEEMLRNVSVIHLCNQVKMNPGVDAHIYDNSCIRIYPVPEKLRWAYGKKKPNPACMQERLEFGAYWQKIEDEWFLCWDKDSLREYVLSHVLLHEIGHSMDDKHCGTRRGEKLAEAFAHHYGSNAEIKRRAKKRKKRLRRYMR